MAVQRSRTAGPERATDRVLMPFAKDDAEGQARVTAFLRELQRKADIELAQMNVRFRGNSGHRDFRASCLLLKAHAAALPPKADIAEREQNVR